MKNKLSLLTLILSILFSNCTNIQTENDEKSKVIEILNIWNKFHNEKDVLSLSKIYGANVLYYGQKKSLSDITNDKSQLFEKFDSFIQENIGIDEISKDLIKEEITISFTKRITTNSKVKDYPSYLIFIKEKDTWKILAESDLITDKNISTKTISNKPGKILGDFNGDGKKEYAWFESPQRLVESEYIIDASTLEEGELHVLYDDFIGGDKSVIHFSDKNIWPITIEASEGEISNLGDLNDDGSDNISVYSSGKKSLTLRVIDANNYYQPYLIEPLYVNPHIHDKVHKEDMLEKIGYKTIRVKYSTLSENAGYSLITKEIEFE